MFGRHPARGIGKIILHFWPTPPSPRFSWEIEGASGKHAIVVEMGNSMRWPERLYLNGKLIKTFDKGKFTLNPRMEYSFMCDGENVIMVYGRGVDLVYRGKLINSGLEYEVSREPLSLGYRILMCLATLASLVWFFLIGFDLQSPMIVFQSTMTVIFALCCTILSWSHATNPLASKRKKLVLSSLMVVYSWAMIYGISKIGLLFLLLD